MWSLLVVIDLLRFVTSIVASPQTIQTASGSTVELPCAVYRRNDSINPAKIVWISDDRADIVSLDSVITLRDPRLSILTFDNGDRQDRILRLSNVVEEDQGLYRCIQGDTIWNEVLLDVLVPPHLVAHSPEHMPVLVREGRDVRFTCRAIGRPPPDILWHVNGVSRAGIIRTVGGHNESVLILRNVSRFDSGRIDCSASNPLSTVNRQFLLQVAYKPMVTVPFRISHYRLNDSARITCQVCSVPSSTIFDFFRPKQSTPIIAGVKEKFDEYLNQTCKQLTITLHFSDSSYFGSYVCRARNTQGVNHAEFALKELSQATKSMKFTPSTSPVSSINQTTPLNLTGTTDRSIFLLLLNIFLNIYFFFCC